MAYGKGYWIRDNNPAGAIPNRHFWAWDGSGVQHRVRTAWAYDPHLGWVQWYPPKHGTTASGGSHGTSATGRVYHTATVRASVFHDIASWRIPSGRHVTKQVVTYGKSLGGTGTMTVSASARSTHLPHGSTHATIRYTYY